MRLTAIILLVFSMHVSAVSYSQNVTLSEKNASLKKVFRQISEQVDYYFLYTDELLQKTNRVSVEAKNAPLETVLQECLANQPFTYQIFDHTIILKPRTAVSDVNNATPPEVITGKVTDETGVGMPGVTIQLQGSTAATVTDVKGDYKLSLPDGVKTGILSFSFIGYKTQDITLGADLAINVKLLPEAKSLNEVVVIGYGTQRRGDVSSAISSVNVEKMDKIPAANLSTALQGQVPGLVATPSSFKPGSGSSIRIRGDRSLTATNDPLVVVDGVPLPPTSTIDDINPLDIESVDVMKDASSTAIYGSRGANGVIQVTTKKGRTGKVTIDYSGTTSFDNILRKLDVFNGPEYTQFKRDAYIGSKTYNAGLSSTGDQRYFPDPMSDVALFNADPVTLKNALAGYTFTKYDPENNIFEAVMRPTTAAEKALLQSLGYPVLNEIAVYDPSKIPTYDWLKDGLRTGATQNQNLSIAGGTEKFSSTFSMGYFNQKGIIPGQDYTRYSFSTSANFKPVKFFNAGGNINYSSAIQNTGTDVYGAAAGQLPIAQPYDSEGNFILLPGNDSKIVNPLNDPNSVKNEGRISHLLTSVFAQVNIMPGLSYKSTFGADINNRRNGSFNGSISSGRAGGGATASYSTTSYLNWTLQNQLSYNTTIAKKHEINATVVQELVKNRQEGVNASATDLTYESQLWYSLQNNKNSQVTYTGNFRQATLNSYLARLIYTYSGKYILTAGYRYDASSVLSALHQGKPFPSGSVAWRLDQENFIKRFDFIDQLKLRVGIGSVGNSGIDPYLTNGTLGITQYNFGGSPASGYAPNGLPLPDLTWEKTTTKDIGLDYDLLRGRISGSIDVYESNSNEIQKQKLPDASGYGSLYVNLGQVRNRGIDIDISTVNINHGAFKWSTDFVFSQNKESIVTLDGSTNSDLGSQWFIGYPIRSYYDYVSQGIFQNSDAQPGGILYDYYWKKAGNKSNSALQPGRIRVEDMNGDTTITEADKVSLGSPNPKWTGSINNTFRYKAFELTAFLYISHGGLVRTPRPSLVGRYQSVKVNYWTPTNPSNEYPQPNTTSDIPLYWQANSFQDGSYAKIRSILLSYQVPASILQKLKLRSLTLSVNAVNPFLFSKFKMYDPETVPYVSSYPSSSTASSSPSSYSYRSLVFGIKAGI